jgi:hypothetical protein
MVAYSFKRQFVAKIVAGTKCQTIRADRKRHARSGERLQIYIGMRTKQCRLVGTAICDSVWPIRLDFFRSTVAGTMPPITTEFDRDEFARADGFESWEKMGTFWRETHDLDVFTGVLIRWIEFVPAVR